MKTFLITLTFLFPINACLAASKVGLITQNIPATHHDRTMQMAVMFPTDAGEEVTVAENAVFFGTKVLKEAKLLPGSYPLILLSHGWGGNYTRMSWLSAGLATRGAIVVSVNHPNSTTGDLNYDSALNHWTRAQDLTAALDHVLKDPTLSSMVDVTRIYAAGFSYGGWTALSIAGAKGQRKGFIQYCEAAGDGSQFCRELRQEGVKISDLDQDKYERSYKDSRIAGVAAIDPGLTWGLNQDDVKELTGSVLIIGLGEAEDRLKATDTSKSGSNFEALVPDAIVENISLAMHFTALGICKPAGEAILIEEQDDPVCTDPVGTDRKAVLDKIILSLATHFGIN